MKFAEFRSWDDLKKDFVTSPVKMNIIKSCDPLMDILPKELINISTETALFFWNSIQKEIPLNSLFPGTSLQKWGSNTITTRDPIKTYRRRDIIMFMTLHGCNSKHKKL